MTEWQNLFASGYSFAEFRSHGFPAEITAVNQIEVRLTASHGLSSGTRQRIASLVNRGYLLVAAELWCPDCQRNVTAFNTLCEQAPALSMRIITRSRAERAIAPALGLDKIAIVLDSNFTPLGQFVERPRKVIAGDANVLDRFHRNDELEAAISDILDLLNVQICAAIV